MTNVKDKIHILIVPSWYPQDKDDIGGIFFREQAQALAEAGLSVSVSYVETRSAKRFLSDKFSCAWKPGFKHTRSGNVEEYRFRIYNWMLKFPGGKEFLIYRKLRRLIPQIEKEQGKIDIIHLHSFLSHGYAAKKICRKKNLPVVLTEHFTGFSRNVLSPRQKRLIRSLLLLADKIIAVGPGLKRDLQTFTEKEIIVVPNMVNVNDFSLHSESRQKRFRFLTVGSLYHKKGYDLQLRAVKELLKSGLDLELTIVGEGEERSHLEQMIHDLSLENQIVLYGKANYDKVPSLMADTDCFLLTSRHETFGVVLIEAMASGKPVIATANPGPASIVTPGTGLLVDNEDVQGIAEAMKKMMKEYNSYHPDEIRRYCCDNFSQEAITSRLIDIYKEVLCPS